jgi:hypothetical protein
MLILWWWLDVWSSWLTVLEAAMPSPVGPPPDHPGKIIDMAHWRRTHPDHTPGHNGWAASPRIGPEARPIGSTAAAAGET